MEITGNENSKFSWNTFSSSELAEVILKRMGTAFNLFSRLQTSFSDEFSAKLSKAMIWNVNQ